MADPKYEWRKVERKIYPTMKRPTITTIPEQTFITLSGQGNPNSPEFAAQVAALYAVSYAIKMAPKKGLSFTGAFDYTVYPLEGRWTLPNKPTGEIIDKDQLVYQIMIKQPHFVNEQVFQTALTLVKNKVAPEVLAQVRLVSVTEGLVGMILHVGSFDTEPTDFERLDYYLHAEGYQRMRPDHKEIYLSDFRRVAEAKRKTILRVAIERSAD
ncbi:GyrI-like domain-containing protein [Furfurilactobacillus curtus]|uniref:GyrI-like small molecule binding domain-containing protein n=1 Tax=Furfurilactobacillus curtus TaxID=1746200 RepID=A0ABQ5JPW8_9LACO